MARGTTKKAALPAKVTAVPPPAGAAAPTPSGSTPAAVVTTPAPAASDTTPTTAVLASSVTDPGTAATARADAAAAPTAVGAPPAATSVAPTTHGAPAAAGAGSGQTVDASAAAMPVYVSMYRKDVALPPGFCVHEVLGGVAGGVVSFRATYGSSQELISLLLSRMPVPLADLYTGTEKRTPEVGHGEPMLTGEAVRAVCKHWKGVWEGRGLQRVMPLVLGLSFVPCYINMIERPQDGRPRVAVAVYLTVYNLPARLRWRATAMTLLAVVEPVHVREDGTITAVQYVSAYQSALRRAVYSELLAGFRKPWEVVDTKSAGRDVWHLVPLPLFILGDTDLVGDVLGSQTSPCMLSGDVCTEQDVMLPSRPSAGGEHVPQLLRSKLDAVEQYRREGGSAPPPEGHPIHEVLSFLKRTRTHYLKPAIYELSEIFPPAAKVYGPTIVCMNVPRILAGACRMLVSLLFTLAKRNSGDGAVDALRARIACMRSFSNGHVELPFVGGMPHIQDVHWPAMLLFAAAAVAEGPTPCLGAHEGQLLQAAEKLVVVETVCRRLVMTPEHLDRVTTYLADVQAAWSAIMPTYALGLHDVLEHVASMVQRVGAVGQIMSPTLDDDMLRSMPFTPRAPADDWPSGAHLFAAEHAHRCMSALANAYPPAILLDNTASAASTPVMERPLSQEYASLPSLRMCLQQWLLQFAPSAPSTVMRRIFTTATEHAHALLVRPRVMVGRVSPASPAALGLHCERYGNREHDNSEFVAISPDAFAPDGPRPSVLMGRVMLLFSVVIPAAWRAGSTFPACTDSLIPVASLPASVAASSALAAGNGPYLHCRLAFVQYLQDAVASPFAHALRSHRLHPFHDLHMPALASAAGVVCLSHIVTTVPVVERCAQTLPTPDLAQGVYVYDPQL